MSRRIIFRDEVVQMLHFFNNKKGIYKLLTILYILALFQLKTPKLIINKKTIACI